MRESVSSGSWTLWLVRHGESDWNSQRLVQGHSDVPMLSGRGERQARGLGRRLSGLGISVLYTSDLRRAARTAAIVAEHLGVEVRSDPRLRERCYGTLEGGPAATLNPADTGITESQIVDPDARPDGGESLVDLFGRAQRFLDSLFAEQMQSREPTAIGIVTHGGMVRALRSCVLGVPVEGAPWDAVPNASVLELSLPACSSSERQPAFAGDEGS